MQQTVLAVTLVAATAVAPRAAGRGRPGSDTQGPPCTVGAMRCIPVVGASDSALVVRRAHRLRQPVPVGLGLHLLRPAGVERLTGATADRKWRHTPRAYTLRPACQATGARDRSSNSDRDAIAGPALFRRDDIASGQSRRWDVDPSILPVRRRRPAGDRLPLLDDGAHARPGKPSSWCEGAWRNPVLRTTRTLPVAHAEQRRCRCARTARISDRARICVPAGHQSST